MRIELISSGTELLNGKVNTNAGYIGSKLYEIGLELSAVVNVSDRKNEFEAELKRAIDRSDVIITTGGLGPTFDDITVESAAECLGREVYIDEKVIADIKSFFDKRNIQGYTKNNEKQAEIIKGAKVLGNQNGTAPGQMIPFEYKSKQENQKPAAKTLFLLPGPPRELKAMFDEYVEPFLRTHISAIKKNEVIRVAGLGESFVEDLVRPIIDSKSTANEGVEFGILAHSGIIDLKFSVTGKDEGQIDAIMKEIRSEIEALLEKNVFGYGKDTISSAIGKLLTAQKKTFCAAESCTGGLISKKVTDTAGSSEYFDGSVISYSNLLKKKVLGVREETLNKSGAVSAQSAQEMARGVLNLSKSDYAVSVTGIAGPDGGSKAKPVGLVYIGIASKNSAKTYEYNFTGNRDDIRERAANTALNLLRLSIMGDKK
ncbi:MAG: competence/damage-inducible protein A [Elusimicrobiota bacterium]|jgi:nicotinamide-nucleotide amidase|nr:competence/damage-inducible protein A [Elusimicrobiota bacterium]